MKIGLALGSGSSRGWAHIGVIKALEAHGVRPDIVCGASIGSLVGAAYAFGNLNRLEEWVLSLRKVEIAKFLRINRSLNGFIDQRRFHDFLHRYVVDGAARIEDSPVIYAAVATELESGRERWLTEGSVQDAVWSSIALPGLFPAIKYQERWLLDGGLVNPVPISVCRALGADLVIAVNLNGDLLSKRVARSAEAAEKAPQEESGFAGLISSFVAEYGTAVFPERNTADTVPNIFEAIAGSINITQDRITRSRMAGDPPDILIAPKLSDIGLMEFHRAREAIEEGRRCVERLSAEIEYLINCN